MELAVIKTGGKQYVVSPGQKLKIENALEQEVNAEVGEEGLPEEEYDSEENSSGNGVVEEVAEE